MRAFSVPLSLACALFLCSRSGFAEEQFPSEVWEEEDLESLTDWDWDPEYLPSSVGLTLDLTAGRRTGFVEDVDSQAVGLEGASYQGREEYYALATLTVPLERLWSESSPNSNKLGKSEFKEAKTAEVSPVTPESRDAQSEKAEPSDDSASQSAQARAEVQESPSDTRGAHQRGSKVRAPGPTDAALLLLVREVADRVGRSYAGAERALSDLAHRSRVSGLAPELRLRGVLGFDETTAIEEAIGIYPGETTTRGARDSLLEARLTFHLDRLVLGDGEESLARQRIQLMADRRKLVSSAIELLMEWRAAVNQAQNSDLLPEETLAASVTAEAALAQLHLLTGGWFRGLVTVKQIESTLPSLSGPK